MAVNFASLIVEMGLLATLILVLHRMTDRYGLGPLLMTLGGIVGILRFASSIGVYISLSDDLNFTVASNVFIPIIIMSVLVIYVSNGTVAARIAIFSIIGVELLTLIIVTSLARHLGLPDSGSFGAFEPDSPIFDVRLRDVFASSTAFIIDLYAVGIIFQACINYVPRLANWIAIGLTLMLVLILNSFVFWSLSAVSIDEFMDFLPGSIVGNLISSAILFPMVVYYLLRVATTLPNFVGVTQRPTFDLLFGSFGQIEQRLLESRTALAETAAQYRELTANINQGFWLFDPTVQKVTYVSPAYEEIWGLSFEVAHQNPTNFLKMIHPDDRPRIEALLPSQFDGTYDESFRIVHDDGTIRWVRDRAFVIHADDGSPFRLAGITEDITERKLAEEHLRYVSDFRELIATLAIGFITIPSEAIDNRIQEVMRLIGEFVDADRVFIGLFQDDLESLKGMYEWCATGIDPIIHNFQNVPASRFPLAADRLLNAETLLVPRVTDLPEDSPIKSELMRFGIQSMLITDVTHSTPQNEVN